MQRVLALKMDMTERARMNYRSDLRQGRKLFSAMAMLAAAVSALSSMRRLWSMEQMAAL